MPAGRVQRIDEGRRVAHIARRGRVYPASLDDVEPRARVPSAFVEFRIVRRRGEESAADVRLRAGTRTSRRQRRFGDLTGARRAGAKVATRAASDYGIDVASPPFQVVEAWLEAMADGDLDGAVALCDPSAVLHRPDGDRVGRRHIRAGLELSPFAGVGADDEEIATDIYGLGRYVRVDGWARGVEHGLAFVVENGAIVEQWLDIEPPQPDAEPAPVPVQTVVRGPVDEEVQTYTERRLAHLLESIGRPVRFCRVKLTAIDNPGSERPAVVEAVLDLDRTMIRAQADAASFTEAVDQMIDRLQARITDRRGRWRAQQRGRVAAHEGETWPPAEADRRFAPDAVQPPPERPDIVRHRSFTPDELTVEEAVSDLDLLDYDFLLFVEAITGEDALLERAADGLVLHLRHRPDDPSVIVEELGPDVALADDEALELTSAEAIDLMEGTGSRHRFYLDRDSGRGNVVYRRLDGHYGLVTPP